MSEYIDVDYELTDDPDVVKITANVTLTSDDDVETYNTPEAGDEGSPLAQAIFAVPGIESLMLEAHSMLVRRDPAVPWHDLVEDVRDALRDFFL